MAWQDRVNRVLGACVRTFRTDCTHTPASPPESDPLDRAGIFNDQYQSVDVETGFVISSLQPNLGIKLADWDPAPVQGDAIEIKGADYRVREVKPDGEGGAVLLLDKLLG